MKSLPKILLTLCVATLGVGIYVSVSHSQFTPVWQAALPLGAILYGLCLITFMMKKETAKFDEEERLRMQSAGHPQTLSLEAGHLGHGLTPKPAH